MFKHVRSSVAVWFKQAVTKQRCVQASYVEKTTLSRDWSVTTGRTCVRDSYIHIGTCGAPRRGGGSPTLAARNHNTSAATHASREAHYTQYAYGRAVEARVLRLSPTVDLVRRFRGPSDRRRFFDGRRSSELELDPPRGSRNGEAGAVRPTMPRPGSADAGASALLPSTSVLSSGGRGRTRGRVPTRLPPPELVPEADPDAQPEAEAEQEPEPEAEPWPEAEAVAVAAAAASVAEPLVEPRAWTGVRKPADAGDSARLIPSPSLATRLMMASAMTAQRHHGVSVRPWTTTRTPPHACPESRRCLCYHRVSQRCPLPGSTRTSQPTQNTLNWSAWWSSGAPGGLDTALRVDATCLAVSTPSQASSQCCVMQSATSQPTERTYTRWRPARCTNGAACIWDGSQTQLT